MASLVTAELGTKDNPHPEEFINSISMEERKKYKGHWIIYKNGLRIIDKNNDLKKRKNRTIRDSKIGWPPNNKKLSFETVSERLGLAGCKLLCNKKNYDKIYVNKYTEYEVQFECGCITKCKISNVITKIKRLIVKHSTTNEEIQKKLENLSPAQISMSEFRRLYDVNGMKCANCNVSGFVNKMYFESRFNRVTNEFKCVNCEEWQDYDTNYGLCSRQDHSKISRRHQCITCTSKANKEWYLSLSFKNVIKRLYKTCVTSHKSRLKKGIHPDCKPEDFVTPPFLQDTIKNKGQISCFTGIVLDWRCGGVENQGTFDRKTNKITYTKSNIQCCTVKENKMKMDMEDEEFIILCGKVWMWCRGKDGYIDSENEKLKKEIEQLKKNNEQLKKNNEQLKERLNKQINLT